jgi:pimeloyl-ACP methyl ester carboxylesterase
VSGPVYLSWAPLATAGVMPTETPRLIMAGMRSETAIDGFRLAYDRTGTGPAVLLLHGWPGDRTDYREVVPLVAPAADVIVPDLRGFGESDKHTADPAAQYSAVAQARSLIGLIGELALGPVVLAGYDIGSRIAQAIARTGPTWSAPWSSRLRCPESETGSSPPGPSGSSGTRPSTTWSCPPSWSTGSRRRSGPTCGTSGRTGPGPATSPPAITSTTWSRSTAGRARSPPRSPGTGRGRDRSPRRWRSRLPPRTAGSRCR